MEYNVQNLEYAVSVFYNGEQEERAKAHTWLTVAQKVPEAWNFVWDLLQPTKGTEVQFYAATTLHTKILRCWNELPSESHGDLLKKLLQAVISYANGPKIVTNRLCISLAAFILQQETMDLAPILTPLTSSANSSLLLEVLTVIPEEFSSMTMGTKRRIENQRILNKSCPMVINDMLKILENVYNDWSSGPPSEDIVNSWTVAATCVGSWLNVIHNEALTESYYTVNERLPLIRALQTIVHVLYMTNGIVSGSVLEACEACLSAVRIATTQTDASRYENFARTAMADLAALVGPVFAANNVPDSVNEELVCAMVTCCVAVCETHSLTLVKAVNSEGEGSGAVALLRLLLEAQAAPGYYPLHETRSNLLFSLWYMLQDDVLTESESAESLHPIWKETFSQLLMAFITKSEMPPESDLSRDDQELIRCYRQDIADAAIYCFMVIGDLCWEIIATVIDTAQKESRVEAALHVLTSLAGVAQSQKAPAALPGLLQWVLQVIAETQDKRTLEAALECIGTYGSWINMIEESVGGTEGLGVRCIRAAGGALSRSPMLAALALRRLATECTVAASLLVEDIVNAAMSPETASYPWVRRQLTSAAGQALASCDFEISSPLLHLLTDHIAKQISSQGSEGGSVAAACASALMIALCPQSPLAAQMFRGLLPSLAPLASNPALVDPLFHILNSTVSALMSDCQLFINEISELTATAFELQPSSTGFGLVVLVTLMVSPDSEIANRLLKCCLRKLVETLLSEDVSTAKGARPDLFEALFLGLHSLTKKRTQSLEWIDSLMPELMNLACRALTVPETRAIRTASTWIGSLTTNNLHTLRLFAPGIMHAVILAISVEGPRGQIEVMTTVLMAINRAANTPNEFSQWLRNPLAEENFPTPHISPADKGKFIESVIREISNKRRLLYVIREFSLACRGLAATEYAKQCIASKQLVA